MTYLLVSFFHLKLYQIFAWKKRFALRRRPLLHQATVVVVPKECFILMAGADLWMWRMSAKPMNLKENQEFSILVIVMSSDIW